ncbi:MAG: hypothetical protein AB7N65_25645 [Vicinamibacterales bacterium]
MDRTASRVRILDIGILLLIQTSRQVEAWRRLSPAERLRLVTAATRAATDLSLAGIRHRYPGVPERECFLRVAAIRLGVDTVRRLYPDAAHLTDLRGPA